MTRNRSWFAAAGLLAAAVVGIIVAQEKQPAPAADKASPVAEKSPRPADDKVIRETSQALTQAFAKGDAKAVAAFWTEEGEYVDDDGTAVRGRAALEKAYAAFFAKRQEVKVESKTNSVRFLGKDTAVEEGTFTVTPNHAPPATSRYSALYARQDGRWLIAMLKEWSDDADHVASLKDLEWLVGTWETEGGEVQARTTYEWSQNKAFIISRYTVTTKNEKAALTTAGTQVIGVDPATGLIRGWTFDANGGIGDASWTHDGERWVIDSDGTLPDGTHASATNFLTRTGDDTFTWRSVQRTLDGERQPDLATVKVKRAQNAK